MKKEVLVHDELGRGFARAVKAGDFLFVAGVTGRLDLKTWQELPEASHNIRFQTRQAMEWLKKVLEQCGTSLENVVKVDMFLKNFQDLPVVMDIWREYFPAHSPPAATAVEVSRLIGIAELEMDAIAVIS